MLSTQSSGEPKKGERGIEILVPVLVKPEDDKDDVAEEDGGRKNLVGSGSAMCST